MDYIGDYGMDFCRKMDSYKSLKSLYEGISNYVDNSMKEDSKIKEYFLRNITTSLYEQDMIRVLSSLDWLNPSKKISVLEGSDAFKTYIAHRMPEITTPVKSLKNLKNFCLTEIKNHIERNTPIISKEEIEEALNFLNKEYDFSNKMFGKSFTSFLIINSGHKELNAATYIFGNIENLKYDFFFFNQKEECTLHPLAVFFHEMGHVIHFNMHKNYDITPELINIFKTIGVTSFETLDEYTQREFIADIFSIALMYNSPFSKYDIYDNIPKEDKEYYHNIVKTIIENM